MCSVLQQKSAEWLFQQRSKIDGLSLAKYGKYLLDIQLNERRQGEIIKARYGDLVMLFAHNFLCHLPFSSSGTTSVLPS